ncbi:phage antirepressor N-terminal domain-containing protein [Pasteurella canis]|uniref:phage antirepressor N-terminal domain-containing protein n=1 Tax=Pasteurella canis TaxID=753 RepID=UPI001E4DF8C0|nr:phage antirepressor N-terminal domain-containing protein [Pasteurella canis]UEC23856.1 phage antirepressor N-terminal domain-containing protein [Pasteurella canis]
MTTQISTQTISFHGSQLITLKVDDVIYTAVKPIVEALGLSWSSQHRKLENSKGKFNCAHMSIVAEDGKLREMLCMPLKKLNGWLFSINPEKVRSDLKEKVIQYQEECFEALYNYWYHGKAERKTTTDERTGLRQAVSQLVSKKGLIYSDAYSLIHQRFNVQHIDELTAEQVPMAVEYVHKIVLEGELITDTSPKIKEDEIVVPYNVFYSLYKHGQRGRQLGYEVSILLDSLLKLLGAEYGRPKLTGLAYDCQAQCIHWLDLAEKIIDKRNLTGVRA